MADSEVLSKHSADVDIRPGKDSDTSSQGTQPVHLTVFSNVFQKKSSRSAGTAAPSTMPQSLGSATFVPQAYGVP